MVLVVTDAADYYFYWFYYKKKAQHIIYIYNIHLLNNNLFTISYFSDIT